MRHSCPVCATKLPENELFLRNAGTFVHCSGCGAVLEWRANVQLLLVLLLALAGTIAAVLLATTLPWYGLLAFIAGLTGTCLWLGWGALDLKVSDRAGAGR